MKKLYFLLLLCLPLLGRAQSKITASEGIWSELQLGIEAGESGTVFLRNSYRINTDSDFNDLKESGVLSNFERVELSVGYEHELSERWRGGGIVRYATENSLNALFISPFVRHSGQIKSLYFNKQLLVDFVKREEEDVTGRFSGMAELGKRVPLGSKFITPSIRYEATLYSELGQQEDIGLEERFIDRTRLRLGLNYELTEKLRINPYFMRQTDYYYVEISPVYDEQGQLIKDGYRTKRNRITPVFGLELRYSLGGNPQPASITY